jgi:hypothetical protein
MSKKLLNILLGVLLITGLVGIYLGYTSIKGFIMHCIIIIYFLLINNDNFFYND